MEALNYQILEAVQGRLRATSEFDAVGLSEDPDAQSAGALKLAIVEPADWRDDDTSDDPDGTQHEVMVRFRIIVSVRAGDPVFRDRELDRLVNVCKNAINGQDLVPGSTIPGWTKLQRGVWEVASSPERRQVIQGETAYFMGEG